MRKIATIALCLILVVSLTLSVSAASAGRFLLKEYDVKAETIYCYGKQLPQGGTLTVTAGSETVDNVIMSTLEKENVPVTVYCLVDSSLSRTESMKQQQEKMLKTLSSLMSGEDSMVLGLLDYFLVEGKPMVDKTARDTAIDAIEGTSWGTNLYDGMSQALETLQSDASYNTNRCLVILSDGHDDGKTSTNADEVLKKIQEADIPVYTVILDTTHTTQKEISYHNQFAEESLGGALYIPENAGISASEAAQQIWERIKGGSVFRMDMDELVNQGTDQQLMIRYDVADTRYEDTILIRAADMKGQPKSDSEEEPTEDGEEGDEDEDEEEEKEIPLEILVIGGIVAALVIAGVAAFILLRKKPVPEYDAPVEFEDDTSGFIQNETLDTNFEFDKDNTLPLDTDSWNPTAPVEGRCHVFAVAIMHPEIATDFYLTPNMETTFGRTNKAEIILCEKDKKLSGLHGCFFWDGKMLLVRDMNSRNGTAVNGEICHNNVWLRLEEGATLRAGSYEYRINFRISDEFKL